MANNTFLRHLTGEEQSAMYLGNLVALRQHMAASRRRNMSTAEVRKWLEEYLPSDPVLCAVLQVRVTLHQTLPSNLSRL